jgi:glycosyltransferase involved in cell wall biosynthesis
MSKIAILTSFRAFHPGYSLTGIVKDQVRMLTEHGHDVTLFVSSDYDGEEIVGVNMSKTVPALEQIDYKSKNDLTPEHHAWIEKATNVLFAELDGYDHAYTHDLVFTGWHLPHCLAIIEAGKLLPKLRWLHWIHSIPSGTRDWWRIPEYGQNHRLVYPNRTDSLRVAECYHGGLDHIRMIPHIRDLRSIFDFSTETCTFMADHPKFLQSDIVQVYPCSSDRLSAKRLDIVINLFGKLKKIGYTVCLVAANQWATGKQRKEDLAEYQAMAVAAGLIPEKEFIFTSLWREPAYETGISKTFLRELTQCTNLFIFPTREESFGLVLPEASLGSGCLCVLNTSLAQQMEISGHNTLGFHFGSYNHNFQPDDFDAYLQDVAFIISARILQDDSVRLKTFMRQHYNYDYLYNRYYAPIMAESQRW